MNDMKTWYQSRTVWGALIAIAASSMQVAGVHIGAADQAQIADAALAIASASGGLLAI